MHSEAKPFAPWWLAAGQVLNTFHCIQLKSYKYENTTPLIRNVVVLLMLQYSQGRVSLKNCFDIGSRTIRFWSQMFQNQFERQQKYIAITARIHIYISFNIKFSSIFSSCTYNVNANVLSSSYQTCCVEARLSTGFMFFHRLNGCASGLVKGRSTARERGLPKLFQALCPLCVSENAANCHLLTRAANKWPGRPLFLVCSGVPSSTVSYFLSTSCRPCTENTAINIFMTKKTLTTR